MKDKPWNPYLAGAVAGALLVVSVWICGEYAGVSTTFVRAAGMIEKTFAPEHVARNEYFRAKKVKVEWQWMFVVGIFLGALVSSLSSGEFKLESVPPMWRARFGGDALLRGVVAFMGGIVAMFGARLAGGCPSGHGLSGLMQLSVSALIAVPCFFIAGVIVAYFLYAGGGAER